MSRLYLLCGPSLSGKSWLASRLSNHLGAVVVSFDELNRERGLPFGLEGLSEAEWAATLDAAVERTTRLMQARRAVIVDDTLCYRWLRDRFRRLAAAHGYEVVLLHLAVGRAQLFARRAEVLARNDRPILSQSGLEAHLAAFEKPADDEHPVRIRSPKDVDEVVAGLCGTIGD